MYIPLFLISYEFVNVHVSFYLHLLGPDSFDLVPKVLGMQLDSFIVEKQEKAGSLANLCPSSYMYREFVDEVKNKEKRKRVEEDVESGEVISVCESEEWEKLVSCCLANCSACSSIQSLAHVLVLVNY